MTVRPIDANKLKKELAPYEENNFSQQIDVILKIVDIQPTLTPPNEKPPCYLPEKDNPYPLCEGRGMKACAHCCLWENYDPEEDEGQVNRPLTLKQLREMEYPVWCVCKTVEGFEGFWCLCNHGYILTPARQIFDVKEIPHWVFYRRPPEEEKL